MFLDRASNDKVHSIVRFTRIIDLLHQLAMTETFQGVDMGSLPRLRRFTAQTTRARNPRLRLHILLDAKHYTKR